MRICIVCNRTVTIRWFREDLVRSLAEHGHDVLVLGDGEEAAWREYFSDLGARYRTYPVVRTGTNIFNGLKTLLSLKSIFDEESPDCVFAYHAKANVYGGLAARLSGVSSLYLSVEGLGSVLLPQSSVKGKIVRTILLAEYRLSLKHASACFFVNVHDRDFFVSHGLVPEEKTIITKGVGVNLDRFSFASLPDGRPSFLFVGRLIREKGLMEYLEAARLLKARGLDAEFRVLGSFDSNPSALTYEQLQPFIDSGAIIYDGEADDVRPHLAACTAFVLPSYYGEGLPKSAMEAMAVGRPLIMADSVGCRDLVHDGFNGMLIPAKDASMLADAMEALAEDEVKAASMGKRSREMAEASFNVTLINRQIMDVIESREPAKLIRGEHVVEVIHYVDGLRGGVLTMIEEYAKHMECIRFLLVSREPASEEETKRAERGGVRVLASGASNARRLREALLAIPQATRSRMLFQTHCNFRNLSPARTAKNCGFAAVISHAHNAYAPSSTLVAVYRSLFRCLIKRYCDCSWACSHESLRMLYGKHPHRPAVIVNPVDAGRFAFSAEIRDAARIRLGATDKPVIMHCGLPMAQKNHPFLFKVFEEVLDLEPTAVLVLVGPNGSEEELRSLCAKAELADHVLFTGQVANPEAYYSAADVICFPSLNEGMPFALLEAQANGLPVVASDRVTTDVDLFGHISFLSLDDNARSWALEVVGKLDGRYEVTPSMIEARGCDARSCSIDLEHRYRALTRSRADKPLLPEEEAEWTA